MSDLCLVAFTAITLAVCFGTAYSILYGTYLDTSDPLLAHLAHPLAKTYWACKSNFINMYFIKLAWGWTSAAFLLLWWFFGPAVIDRVVLVSGGECFVPLPSGDLMTVPTNYCLTKSTVTQTTHPDIFLSSLIIPKGWSGIPRDMNDVSGHIFLLTMSMLFLADQLCLSLRSVAIAANLILMGIWLFASLTYEISSHHLITFISPPNGM
ncbi:hypothetical protein BT96DRAFT_956097 [Gymnopus androsaceus JB14]|uniref:Uncharacterized protein n=1 Tax=Gymnopus androsaceus JB14 TaxID=1447944 RepID=A0A6A4HWN3_9AGAR|nr:hypothetical protein BT96DRAFT_956097 [Gymnopus androsaceus JB14]